METTQDPLGTRPARQLTRHYLEIVPYNEAALGQERCLSEFTAIPLNSRPSPK